MLSDCCCTFCCNVACVVLQPAEITVQVQTPDGVLHPETIHLKAAESCSDLYLAMAKRLCIGVDDMMLEWQGTLKTPGKSTILPLET